MDNSNLKKINFLFLFIVLNISLTATSLKEVITKGPIENIRYISHDGKLTYFQKRSGGLFISSNFSVKKLLDGNKNTMFYVTAGSDYKKILILKQENIHQFFSEKNYDIYSAEVGSDKTNYLGKGRYAKLLLNDNWVGIARLDGEIYFQLLGNKKTNFKIKTNLSWDTYFFSDFEMRNINEVLFIDLTNDNHEIIYSYNRVLKKKEVFFKTKSPYRQLSFCRIENTTYLGDFLKIQNSKRSKSAIYKLYFDGKKQVEPIYESRTNDIGPILCNNFSKSIFFIKNYREKKKSSYDVVSLDIENKKLKRHTFMNNIDLIQYLGNAIVLPIEGRVLMIQGLNHDPNEEVFSNSYNK